MRSIDFCSVSFFFWVELDVDRLLLMPITSINRFDYKTIYLKNDLTPDRGMFHLNIIQTALLYLTMLLN